VVGKCEMGQKANTSGADGRSEKRIAREVPVDIYRQDEPIRKERAWTENVSPHGARALVEQVWRPRQHVLLISPKEGVQLRGQIIYSQRLTKTRFAVGLLLFSRAEAWARA
jgi:hypothetical protein